ncbi:hypothetical protein GCM10027062_15470 [Nocardioides hungaricus]
MNRNLADELKQVAQSPTIAPPPTIDALVTRSHRHRGLMTGAVVIALAAAALAVVRVLPDNGGSATQPVTSAQTRATGDVISDDPFVLDCPPGISRDDVSIDFGPDGYTSAQEAVSGMLQDGESASEARATTTNGEAEIALIRRDGTTRAVVTVAKYESRWRPSAVSGCAGETIGLK